MQKVQERGYKVFALGFYGECFAGKDEKLFEDMLLDQSASSTGCIKHDYGACDDSNKTCIGGANAEFAYKMPFKAAERKYNDKSLLKFYN